MSFKVKDHYFNKAKKENYLARSVYKLQEINEKFKVLKKGDFVLDIGYFPGSWIQYTCEKVAPNGRVIGIDIQEKNESLEQLKNVRLFQMDINDLKQASDIGIERPFSVILSDMAPKTTGIKSVDQDRSLLLIEDLFAKFPAFLAKNGNTVVKVFDSNAAQEFLKKQKNLFNEFSLFRPKSTRSVSKEFFVIGKGFKA